MIVWHAYKNKVIYIDDDGRIEYNKGKICYIDNRNNCVVFQYGFRTNFLIKLFSGISIFERLLRCEPRYATRWSKTEFLVSHRRYLYKIDLEKRIGIPLFQYAYGTNNPLHFCNYIRKGNNELVFGDYGGHDTRGNVGIYRYTEDGLCEIACFPKDKICHVHRVEYDMYRDIYWIFTGDADKESGIWHVKYEGGQIVPYLIGKQKYRACVAFVKRETLLFATDSPHEKNYIYSVNIKNKNVRQLGCLPGPCINGASVKTDSEENYCFSTSVEPDSMLPKCVYMFTYKLGRGIADRFSYVIIGNEKSGFETVWHSKKDIFPMWFFQFGNHRFPNQQVHNKVYFCPQSCSGVNGTFVCDLSGEGGTELGG